MCLFTTTQWGLIHLVPPLAGVSHRPRNSEFRSLPRSSTYSLLCSYWLLSSLLNQSESALSRDTFNSVQKDYPTAGFFPTLAALDTWISHCVVERHTAHRAHAVLCPCSEAGFQVLHRQAIMVLLCLPPVSFIFLDVHFMLVLFFFLIFFVLPTLLTASICC